MQQRTVVETIETKAHRILINGDNIVRVYSKPSHIELEDMEALFAAYAKLRPGKEKLLVLLDPTQENSMTSEARSYVIKHLKDNVKCIAVIGRKKFIRTLFAVISSVMDIGVHMKMFGSVEEAEKWLTHECQKKK